MNDAATLKNLGLAIRRRRRELGLSQEGLAEWAGLHRNYIGGVERGERNLGFRNLVQIASALEITMVDLMRRIEDESMIDEGSV